MRIIFSKGRNPIAGLICWALDEEFSHVAIEHRGMVYHVNMLGMRVEPTREFMGRVEYSMSVPVKNNWLRLYPVVSGNWNTSYDWRAFLQLGTRALIKKLTFGRVKIPKANLHQMTGMFICTEFVTKVMTGEEDQLTPYQLFEILVR